MYLLRNEESEIPRQARNDNYVKLNLFQLLINLYHVILKRVQNDFLIVMLSDFRFVRIRKSYRNI